MDATLARNLDDTVRLAFGHAAPTPALVLFDRGSPLARLLAEGYRAALPHAAFVDVDAEAPDALLARVDALPRGSLVALVQSTRFALGTFRFRLELFRRGLAVVEHPHLGRVRDDELRAYVDALAYDPAYYRPLGRALKARLDAARAVAVVTPLGTLAYGGPFEDAKLNVGDYGHLDTVGGQFPIGEVFTEPADLDAVSGTVAIAAFGARDFSVTFLPRPFALRVERGRVVAAPGAPAAFDEVLADIADAEGDVRVRELGFGLNPAFTAERRCADISAYERMCGVHLSLGAKHTVYAKPDVDKRRARFHVDVFVATERVEIDGDVVYERGAYTLTAGR